MQSLIPPKLSNKGEMSSSKTAMLTIIRIARSTLQQIFIIPCPSPCIVRMIE